MKKLLLETKWIGVLCAAVVCLLMALKITGATQTVIKTYTPTVVAEAEQFLPVTLENGEIVAPQDAYIAKNYGSAQNPVLVVLDTRTDELNAEQIKNSGIYFSRKFMYGVTKQKTEIRDFSEMPNMTVDKNLLNDGADWLVNNSGAYIFATLFLSLLLYVALVVLICAGLIQLLLGRMLNVDFYRTLRVTTLTYLLLLLLEFFFVPLKIYIIFAILLAANWGVAKYSK